MDEAGLVSGGGDLLQRRLCFLSNLSEVRMLTTLYLTKNDHQWVTRSAASGLKRTLGVPTAIEDYSAGLLRGEAIYHLGFAVQPLGKEARPCGSRRGP